VSFQRGIGGPEPVDPEPVGRTSSYEEHRVARSTRLATGTLACPSCDAPVAPAGPVSPADPLACPYCGRAGAVRDFLSLSQPTRPAHVEVRVVMRRGPRVELRRAPLD
jgi:hypothetical protein